MSPHGRPDIIDDHVTDLIRTMFRVNEKASEGACDDLRYMLVFADSLNFFGGQITERKAVVERYHGLPPFQKARMGASEKETLILVRSMPPPGGGLQLEEHEAFASGKTLRLRASKGVKALRESQATLRYRLISSIGS
jgi:hypothetical protein